MQERMDNLYDRIAELEEAITDVETKIGASYGKQVTGKKIYQFLLDFDCFLQVLGQLLQV